MFYIKFQLTKYLSAFHLKYYFAVDNTYVGKKLGLILFPFFHQVSFLTTQVVSLLILNLLLHVAYNFRIGLSSMILRILLNPHDQMSTHLIYIFH